MLHINPNRRFDARAAKRDVFFTCDPDSLHWQNLKRPTAAESGEIDTGGGSFHEWETKKMIKEALASGLLHHKDQKLLRGTNCQTEAARQVCVRCSRFGAPGPLRQQEGWEHLGRGRGAGYSAKAPLRLPPGPPPSIAKDGDAHLRPPGPPPTHLPMSGPPPAQKSLPDPMIKPGVLELVILVLAIREVKFQVQTTRAGLR